MLSLVVQELCKSPGTFHPGYMRFNMAADEGLYMYSCATSLVGCVYKLIKNHTITFKGKALSVMCGQYYFCSIFVLANADQKKGEAQSEGILLVFSS